MMFLSLSPFNSFSVCDKEKEMSGKTSKILSNFTENTDNSIQSILNFGKHLVYQKILMNTESNKFEM